MCVFTDCGTHKNLIRTNGLMQNISADVYTPLQDYLLTVEEKLILLIEILLKT